MMKILKFSDFAIGNRQHSLKTEQIKFNLYYSRICNSSQLALHKLMYTYFFLKHTYFFDYKKGLIKRIIEC